jgi:hypothetical protein
MPGEESSKVAGETGSDKQPVALLFYTDLMFGVELQSMAGKAGYRFVNLRPGTPIPEGDMLVVDMGARGDWQGAIREAHERGIEVVAFGSHTDTEARRAAKRAGAARVLANSNLARDLPSILVEHIQRQNELAPRGRTLSKLTGEITGESIDGAN